MRVLRQPRASVLVLTLLLLALVGCSSDAADVNGAARNVEAYLQARVASDADTMINLSCAAWEGTAKVEATSFKSLKARLEGVSCSATAGAAGTATVNCAGKVLTTYNGEDRALNLADKPFSSVVEAGEWRMCGYR
jgi:hypothetical protein